MFDILGGEQGAERGEETDMKGGIKGKERRVRAFEGRALKDLCELLILVLWYSMF